MAGGCGVDVADLMPRRLQWSAGGLVNDSANTIYMIRYRGPMRPLLTS